MKKAISLLILASLLFALTACGKEDVRYYCTETILEDLSIGDVTRVEYLYDAQWNNTEVITYLNGEEISRSVYEYHGDNVTVTTVSGEFSETVDIVNSLDEKGNVIRSIQSIAGEIVCTTENTYDETDNLLQTRSDYGNGFVSTTEYTYDSSGALLSATLFQEGFGVLTRQECETAADGTKTIRLLDADGKLTGYYLVRSDEAGNNLQQEYYDPTGNLLNITTSTYEGTDGSISTGASG